MINLYLQNIISDISNDILPPNWQGFEFAKFSSAKTLYSFQQNALENSVKALWLFYEQLKGEKSELYNYYKANGLTDDFDYQLSEREGKKTSKYFIEYENDYPVVENKISFAHFINRMSFWMATG